jgi:hypothetical protein
MSNINLARQLKGHLLDHGLLEQHFTGLGPDDIIRAYTKCLDYGEHPIDLAGLSKHIEDAKDPGDFLLRVMTDLAYQNILDLQPDPKRV